jgi:hypothetical protein
VITTPTIDHFERVAENRIVKATVDGRDAWAFTVRSGDVQEWDRSNVGPGGMPNQRAEISYAPPASGDKPKSPYNVTDKTGRRVYRIGIKFGDGYPMDQRWATLLQFHWADVDAKPGFGGIAIHGDHLDFGNPVDPSKNFASLPVRPGQWYDLKLDINWSAEQDGWVKVYNGDQLVGQYTGPTTGRGTYQYLKQGYYRDGAIPQTGTVYQTQVTIDDAPADAAQPAPAPAPALTPAPIPAKAQAGLDLLVALGPRLEGQAAAAMKLKADFNAAIDNLLVELTRARNDVKALLDRGPWA